MSNKKKGFIVITLLLICFSLYKDSIGFTWKEKIEMPKAQIVDSVIYESVNAIIIFDKKEAIAELRKILEEFPNPTFLPLLGHLDSTSKTFNLKHSDLFTMKLDSTSVGHVKSVNSNTDIKMSDWSKDTVGLVKDYNDKRNYYTDAIDRITSRIIEKRQVVILDKKNLERQGEIVFKEHKCGIANYFAHYEFLDGRWICGKASIYGL